MQLAALKSEQQKIFKRLKNFPEFYLVGGTALALQMSHRISIDFDLFSPNEIPRNLMAKLRKIFKDFKIEVILNHSEQLSIKAGQTKIDFVKYGFPLISKLINFEGVKLVSVPEIAAMKAFAVGQRGTLKDYVDLYFILEKKRANLSEIKKLAEEKYKKEFNFRLFLEQLVYLEDIKIEQIEFTKEEIAKEQLQEFFQKEIQKLKL